MEISVKPLSNGSVASNGYHESHYGQGSSELEPFKPTSASPAAPAAATAPNASSNSEQAAQLRALLASHLSGNGSINNLGTEHPPLEALLDVLYSMTVPAGDAVAPPSEVASHPVASNAAAPVAAEVTAPTVDNVTAPAASDPTTPEPLSSAAPVLEMEATPAPEIVPVAEATPVTRPAEEPSIETAGGEPYTFVIPSAAQNSVPPANVTESAQSATESALTESVSAPMPLGDVPHSDPVPLVENREAVQPTPAPEPMIVEAPPVTPIAEDTPAPLMETREIEASEPIAHSTPPETVIMADSDASMTDGALEGELGEAEDASTSIGLPVEMPLPGVVQEAADKVTFSLTTAKTNASLQLPVLPNLSLLVLEQRADEIVIKIHFAL